MNPDTPTHGSFQANGAGTVSANRVTESTHSEFQAESDHTYTCPLCTFIDDSQQTVYEHLLSSHRKRAISTALFESHVDPQP
ncbi:hypothetical protein HALLA_03480 (plasmid) [Halostagnicola larsenii XH-48]|uniref:Uncharacterized protein n=1 Tax=Halostagnicola larsenii XH-48 TaxID=797299 RepID=W0JWN3_9EURY|nr:hypothetical protein [Halostagnicola larsenii]AHG01463.1 hypothetical protein HALLA_03480 [Halostagnicola larsenii XH-48]